MVGDQRVLNPGTRTGIPRTGSRDPSLRTARRISLACNRTRRTHRHQPTSAMHHHARITNRRAANSWPGSTSPSRSANSQVLCTTHVAHHILQSHATAETQERYGGSGHDPKEPPPRLAELRDITRSVPMITTCCWHCSMFGGEFAADSSSKNAALRSTRATHAETGTTPHTRCATP